MLSTSSAMRSFRYWDTLIRDYGYVLVDHILLLFTFLGNLALSLRCRVQTSAMLVHKSTWRIMHRKVVIL